MKKIISFLMFLAFFSPLLANAQAVENLMRSNGRIYVVVAVILIIFSGLILYLVKIERKINKLKNRESQT